MTMAKGDIHVKKKHLLIILLVLSIALFTAAIALTQDEEPETPDVEQPGEGVDAESTVTGPASEQSEEDRNTGQSPEVILANLGGDITYQGQLSDDGSPASGNYEFSFELYDDLAAGVQIGSTVTQTLSVENGLFTAVLDFGNVFDGTALFLEIGVRPDGSADPFTTLTPRQSLTAAPYAHTLRPGADIMGNTLNDASISARNTAASGSISYALRGQTDSNSGSVAGVYGQVTSTSPGGYSAGVRGVNNGTGGNGIGVWGSQNGSGWGLYGTSVTGYGAYITSSSAGGRGLYARAGSNSDADIVLGGNNSTDDDGRITTAPNLSGSDMYLISNDAVVVQLDADNSNEDADFLIQDKDSNTIFNFDESGQLSLYEPGVGEMIEMVTTELGTDGAQITLRNNAGQATVVLDAEYNAGGNGRITTEVLQITGGSDLSEQFDIQASRDKTAPQAGYVVSIDAANPGDLTVSSHAYDRTVAGVVSGAGDVQPGMLMGQQDTAADGQYPVALTGRVYVWVDADYGAVEPGDLLTTSDTPGHAMKVGKYDQAQGAILGKAMTSLESGQGLVLVLVTLQ
jgi:hypothetical protein